MHCQDNFFYIYYLITHVMKKKHTHTHTSEMELYLSVGPAFL